MPIAEIQQGISPAQPLWRYMDFGAFASLLATDSLFFRCVGKFDDPYEAAVPTPHAKAWAESISKELDAKGLHGTMASEFGSSAVNFIRHYKSTVFANCWHMNENESAAMWSLYGYSVAVESSVERLAASFAPFEERVELGAVRYIDYNATSDLSTYPVYLTKRRSFEHEKELRAYFHDWRLHTKLINPGASDGAGGKLLAILEDESIKERVGESVRIDTGKLLVRVKTPDLWLVGTIRSVLEKYGHNIPVEHADIAQAPI